VTQPARGLDETVGPYRLIRAIGAGGSARIDLARIDRAYNFQRHVVIKRPLEHLRGDPLVAASLRREARIGGRLRHPNLVAVLDAGIHDGYDYLALEYIHGTSLRDLMQLEAASGQVRALPLPVALGIVIDIARGLHDAHELVDEHGEPLGLVHRDISPGNVLLGLDGAVKVADFGIAKETRVSTLSGSMHGTVTYMAPEQCRGHAFDRRADIWALGVILYELATHQRLFWADNDVASLHRVLSGQITRPRKLEPSLPTSLEDIIMTTVAQDPAGRFATARELADSLETFAAIQGLVVGARWLARTVEEAVGARQAPWIAATTVVTPEHEPSLVAVIERDVELEPELLPTFGPADGLAEDDSLPNAAAIPRRPGRARWVPFAIAGAVLGVGLGAVLALQSGGEPASHHAAAPPPPAIRAETRESPPPAPSQPPPSEAEDVAAVPAGSAANPHPASRAHRHHLTNPPATGSSAVASQPVPDPSSSPAIGSASGSAGSAAGSAARPANVEWKPSMLLPTDKGSGTTKSP